MENKYLYDESEINFDNNFNESMHHALFDAYLNPNMGNDTKKSLNFFLDKLIEFNNLEVNNNNIKQVDNLCTLIQNTINIYENVQNLYSKKIKDNEINLIKLNVEKRIQITTWVYYEIIDVDDLMSRLKKSKNFEDDVQITVDFFSNSKKLKDKIKILFKHHNNILLTSGYATKVGSHLIIIYLDYVNKQAILCNSGDGLEYHTEVDGLFQGIVRKELSEDKMDELIILSFLFNYVFKSNSEIYYKYVVKPYFSYNAINGKIISERTDLMIKTQFDMISEQMSGTCTYFGILYFIKYFFYMYLIPTSLIDPFNEFVQYIEKTTSENLIFHIEKKQVMHECWKNYCDILKQNKLIDDIRLKNLYDKYKKNIIESTKYDNDLKNIDQLIVLNKRNFIKFEFHEFIYWSDVKNMKIEYILNQLSIYLKNLYYQFDNYYQKHQSDAIISCNIIYVSIIEYLINLMLKICNDKNIIFFITSKKCIHNFVIIRLVFYLLFQSFDYLYFNFHKKDDNTVEEYAILNLCLGVLLFKINEMSKNIFLFEKSNEKILNNIIPNLLKIYSENHTLEKLDYNLICKYYDICVFQIEGNQTKILFDPTKYGYNDKIEFIKKIRDDEELFGLFFL